MSKSELDLLLMRIRDGEVSPAEFARAQELIQLDARIPDELKSDEDLFEDEPGFAATALLAVLGVEDDGLGALLADAIRAEVVSDGPPEAVITAADLDGDEAWEEIAQILRRGLVAEAVGIEVADRVLEAVGLVDQQVPLAEAVRFEAGQLDVVAEILVGIGRPAPNWPIETAIRAEAGESDVADSVMTQTGLKESAFPLRSAVLHLAGHIDVADQVMASLGLEDHRIAVGEAVRAEAGSVDVAAEVMDRSSVTVHSFPLAAAIRAEAGDVDVSDAVMNAVRRTAVAPTPKSWVAANRRTVWGVITLAAAALLTVVAGYPLLMEDDPDRAFRVDEENYDFASADEITIEDLEYAEDAFIQVMQADEEAGAPMIVWVQEG